METQKFSSTDGQKRKGVVLSCELCQKEFISRKDQLRKFCSKECSQLGSRKRTDCECAFCHKIFEKRNSKLNNSRSGLHFCTKKCKDTAQMIGGIKEIMPPHYGTGKYSDAYRRAYKTLNNIDKLVCKRCDYCEFECGIDIHHINKNRNDNSIENLIALCSPCHKALHCKCWCLSEIKGLSINQ